MCVCACQGNLESAKEAAMLTAGGEHLGSLPVPHRPLWAKGARCAVPRAGLPRPVLASSHPRRLAGWQPLRHRCGRSSAQAQARRFQAGKRLQGKAGPLVGACCIRQFSAAISDDALGILPLQQSDVIRRLSVFCRGSWVGNGYVV